MLPRSRSFLASGVGANLSGAARAHDRRRRPQAARRTSSRGCWVNGCRSGSASNSSSRTGPALAAISRQRLVVRAPADGYTALIVNTSAAINATLYDKLNFNFLRDIAPVAAIIGVPGAMVVHPSVPANTVPEFIAYAKANPGKVNMASAGTGSAPHVYGELFKMMAGVDMLHVPYRGGAPALTDLLGGQVQVYFESAARDDRTH